MSTIPLNSELERPFKAPTKIRQEPERDPYRRLDFHWPLFYQEFDQTFQTLNSTGNMDSTQIAFGTEGDQKILDPKRQDEEILDPEREDKEILDPERKSSENEDEEYNNPNRNVPEEDNDLTNDDGAIIKEPTRELDDPYRPGHADRENIPPIKEEFPNSNPRENTVTN